MAYEFSFITVEVVGLQGVDLLVGVGSPEVDLLVGVVGSQGVDLLVGVVGRPVRAEPAARELFGVTG